MSPPLGARYSIACERTRALSSVKFAIFGVKHGGSRTEEEAAVGRRALIRNVEARCLRPALSCNSRQQEKSSDLHSDAERGNVTAAYTIALACGGCSLSRI